MTEYITFHEHRVDNPEGLVFFSPPYLFSRNTYEAIFSVFKTLDLEVIECERNDLEMTRDVNGMAKVAKAMTNKLSSLKGRAMLDVGMSLGAGFTALGRERSETEPTSRLVLSPAPDPVTPWDEGVFLPFLKKVNGDEDFVAGTGNYDVLQAIREANLKLDSLVPTEIIAEKSRGVNTLESIIKWGKMVGAKVDECVYAHGTYKGKGALNDKTMEALLRMK